MRQCARFKSFKFENHAGSILEFRATCRLSPWRNAGATIEPGSGFLTDLLRPFCKLGRRALGLFQQDPSLGATPCGRHAHRGLRLFQQGSQESETFGMGVYCVKQAVPLFEQAVAPADMIRGRDLSV